MRQEDIREALDLGGLSPYQAVEAAIKASYWPGKAYIAYVSDKPSILFGLSPSGSCLGCGHCWLFGSDDMARLPLECIRRSKRYVKEWLEEYPILTNIVDARNETHIRWLKFMGASFVKDWPDSGPGRVLAKQFVIIKGDI